MLKYGFIVYYVLLISKYISTEDCPEFNTQILEAVPLTENEEKQVQEPSKFHDIQRPSLYGDELNTRFNLSPPKDMLDNDAPNQDLAEKYQNPAAYGNSNWRFRDIMPYRYMTAGIPLNLPLHDNSNIYGPADYVSINRIERTLPDDDGALWDELEEEAVMHNVLPIMPAPYFRSSQDQGIPYSSPIAIFLDKVSDCAIPILVSCSPQITRGRMSGMKVAMPIKYDFPKNR